MVIDGDSTENWASDDDGWALDCDFDVSGWSSQMDEDGALIITSVGTGSSQATCSLVDPFGATSESSRTWTFGQLFTSSAIINEQTEELELTITPTGLVGEMTMMVHAHQPENMADGKTITVANDEITTSLSLKKLRPGMVMVMGTADATNMREYTFMLNFGLEKASSPPMIELTIGLDMENATWDEVYSEFTLKGKVIDPDGEDVTMSLAICGGSTTNFIRDGINWEIDVSIASCSPQGITEYNVIISATDESGVIGTLAVFVPDPYAEDDGGDGTISDIKTSEERGLPSLSMLSTLIITLLAMAFWQRKQYL